MLRLARLVLTSSLLLVVAAPMAAAYVLPADYMLRLLAAKRRDMGVKDMSLQLTTELDGADAPFDERLYLKVPERLRLVTLRDDETHVYVEREGTRARGKEGALTRVSGPAHDLIARLLVPGGKDLDEMNARLVAAIKSVGIDPSITALGRDGDTVAYIIGARPWETDKPQLWLHKETFLPMRLVTIDKSQGQARREVRYLEFGSSTGGDFWPAVVEEYVNGKLVRRAELSKLQVNQNLPETLFDVPGK